MIYKNFDTLDDLFISVGQDKLHPREILWEMVSVPPPDGTKERYKHGDRNFINISRLESGVHKFSMCCKPLPGLDKTVATLSERGISFHRDHCREYMASSNYSAEKILDVWWNLSSHWKTPLEFELFIKGKRVDECLPILASGAHNATVHHIEERGRRGKGVIMRVTLDSFPASKAFFNCFEQARVKVVIEGYGRDRLQF